jgi:hypothetical protein
MSFGGYEGIQQRDVFFCREHPSQDIQGFTRFELLGRPGRLRLARLNILVMPEQIRRVVGGLDGY